MGTRSGYILAGKDVSEESGLSSADIKPMMEFVNNLFVFMCEKIKDSENKELQNELIIAIESNKNGYQLYNKFVKEWITNTKRSRREKDA